MRPAGGAVRDRALHFRYAPRRLCRSSLAPAHQAVALSPFIDNPRRNASSLATPLLARGRPRSLPCLRLVAPVENRARLGFASLASRVFAQPRRSCRMVSIRAYSSPMPQPASRHSIKPLFDVQVGCDHRARRGRVGAPRRPLVPVVSKNSTLQLQLRLKHPNTCKCCHCGNVANTNTNSQLTHAKFAKCAKVCFRFALRT